MARPSKWGTAEAVAIKISIESLLKADASLVKNKHKLLVKAQEVLSPDKQYGVASLATRAAALYRTVMGEPSPPPKDSALPYKDPTPILARVEDPVNLVDEGTHDKLEEIKETLLREVGALLKEHLNAGHLFTKHQLNEFANSLQTKDIKKAYRPRILILGMDEGQHSIPQLTPFEHVLDIHPFERKASDSIDNEAKKADYILVLVNKTSHDIYVHAHKHAARKIVPVRGGISALESALVSICVSNKIDVKLSNPGGEQK